MEEDNAAKNGADRADPRPNGVSCSKWQCFQGVGKQCEAQKHKDNREDAWPKLCKSIRITHSGGPGGFHEPGDNKTDPIHFLFLL